MDASPEIILNTPFFRVYKDRRVDRLVGTRTVPPGLDADTGVTSKDVVIDDDTGVYVRLYLPGLAARSDSNAGKKLPVLVYFHGGGFIIESAASPRYHRFLNSLAARACLLVVSVNYRLAPEHPLPAGYDDSFRALKWAVSGTGDPWLSEHGDLGRVFLAGDSAGGNIVHNVAMMAACDHTGSDDVAARIERAALLHAAFGGRDPIDGETTEFVTLTEKLWRVACPDAEEGADDPRTNPLVTAAAAAPILRDLPCKRVLVCAARRRGTCCGRGAGRTTRASRRAGAVALSSGSSPWASGTSSSCTNPTALRPRCSWTGWSLSSLKTECAAASGVKVPEWTRWL